MAKQGQFSYPDGSVYNGQWDPEGRRHGFGRLTFGDGSKFRGNFDKGFYSELGVIDFADGSRYEGEFKEGKFHGFGVFVSSDMVRYDGEFRSGQMCGLGAVAFRDGSRGLPRNEGYFDGRTIVRRENCPRIVQRARDAADNARTLKGV